MLNDDVSDLFDRVKVGTRVVVLPGGAPPAIDRDRFGAAAAARSGPGAGVNAPVPGHAAHRGAAAARAGDGQVSSRVPDAVQRSSRRSAEPGPNSQSCKL